MNGHHERPRLGDPRHEGRPRPRGATQLGGALLALAFSLGARAQGTFEPGEIVLVERMGATVEARVLKQDASGVLILHKDWKDGTFHEDGHREYRRPDALRRKTAPEGAPAGPVPPPRATAAPASPPPPPRPPSPARTPDGAPATPAGQDARALPDGEYACTTYNPGAVHVGTFTVRGDRYSSEAGASGRYSISGGRVDFLGAPPLGFRAGVLEELEPAKVRLYRDAKDIGSKWRAAVCTRRIAPAGPKDGPGAAPFRPGQAVEATFLGYWYGATVVRCEEARCLLRYDDPTSKDAWVETSRIRSR